MTGLPDKNRLEGAKQLETTTGEFRLAKGNRHQYQSGLSGDDSAGKRFAHKISGVQEKYLADAEGNANTIRPIPLQPSLNVLPHRSGMA